MLTADQLDDAIDPIMELYERYQQSVINDIARRISGLRWDSAAWQVQRMTESGSLYKDIVEKLAVVTNYSKSELRQLFKKAGVRAMRYDDSVYLEAGLHPVPLNLSPAMLQVLIAGAEKTGFTMRNLTRTTAITGQDAFVDAADLAYMQISTGVMSQQQAIKQAIKNVAEQGLQVIDYASGKRDQLDVAMRRTALTGVNSTVGRLQMKRADEMGCDLVQTSAHIGARPDHQVWQGRVFSRSGTSAKYPPFVESTGYGTGAGLMGWNCRHSFFPFFEGISENAYSSKELREYENKQVTYNGQKMPIYEATQMQRYIERKIRHWKRQAGALDAGNLESSFEHAKVKEWQQRMRDFIRQTGLQRQREREWVLAGKGTTGVPPTNPPVKPSPTSPVPPTPAPISGMGQELAQAFGYPVNLLDLRPETGPVFRVGNQAFTTGGTYSPTTRTITLYGAKPENADFLSQIMAHEVQHDRWQWFLQRMEEQSSELQRVMAGIPDWHDWPMWASGQIKNEYKQQYWAIDLRDWIDKNRAKLAQEDGVTQYSRAYWEAAESGKTDAFYRAVNETLAEMARLEKTRRSVWPWGDDPFRDISLDWQALYYWVRDATNIR